MLTALDIQNVVLIEKLSLQGDSGLVALTGETGAGKSILLDALGLALGNRADAGMVRHGSEQASVTATFDLPPAHPAFPFLKEKEIDLGGETTLILRRTVAKDGRSKAFVNDNAIGVQSLRDLGNLLIEIHGQFDTHGLLDPATHGPVIDAYAGLTAEADKVETAWHSWKASQKKRDDALSAVEGLKAQEDYLTHVVKELDAAGPEEGEEEALSEKRIRLKNSEKQNRAFADTADIMSGDDGILQLITRTESALSRLSVPGDDSLNGVMDALSRARAELEDASWQIEKLAAANSTGENLEEIEDRYFLLRDLAKKHRVTADALPALHRELSDKLKLITQQDKTIGDLEKQVELSRAQYIAIAGGLTAKRRKAAEKIAKALNAELPDLKLEKAVFSIDVATMSDEKDWTPRGFERMQFMVSTNPGAPAGPLQKIASGGEMSRLMLALKVVLAETGSVPTLIFDEVDSGIGGATADAVGSRLQRLAQRYQVLVVTHSPQVAARAEHHWHVAKESTKGKTTTSIAPLESIAARQEEIARMLSGAEVTAEARAQAAKLLKNSEKHAA